MCRNSLIEIFASTQCVVRTLSLHSNPAVFCANIVLAVDSIYMSPSIKWIYWDAFGQASLKQRKLLQTRKAISFYDRSTMIAIGELESPHCATTKSFICTGGVCLNPFPIRLTFSSASIYSFLSSSRYQPQLLYVLPGIIQSAFSLPLLPYISELWTARASLIFVVVLYKSFERVWQHSSLPTSSASHLVSQNRRQHNSSRATPESTLLSDSCFFVTL